jgi:hypothetical protein
VDEGTDASGLKNAAIPLLDAFELYSSRLTPALYTQLP